MKVGCVQPHPTSKFKDSAITISASFGATMANVLRIHLLLLILTTFVTFTPSYSRGVSPTKLAKKRVLPAVPRKPRSLEYSESESISASASAEESNEDFNDLFRERRSAKPFQTVRPFAARKPVARLRPNKPNKPRADAPCDSDPGRNGGQDEPAAWPVDTGAVPDSIQGGGANDGLDGIAGTPDTTNSPWNDIFNANPADNNANAQPPDSGSNWGTDDNNNPPPDGGSNWGTDDNNNPPSDGGSNWGTDDNNSPPADSGSNWGTDDNTIPPADGGSDWAPDVTNSDDQTWPPAESTDTPPAGGNNVPGEEPDCTCMSILQCGGTFRSGDVGPDTCADGEVCCPTENPELPVGTVPPTLRQTCGVGHANKSVKARLMTRTTAFFGELPWTVILLTKQDDEDAMFCAGVIVDSQIVLTAAHCLDRFRNSPDAVTVRGGEWDTSTWGREPLPTQDRKIQSITFHPLYRSGHPSYDFAIILVRDPFIPADNVNAACLPSDLVKVDKTFCIASGWGKFPKEQQQEVMKKIGLPIIDADPCEKALRSTRLGKYFRLHASFVCAGANGNDVCLGDGGGPLTCPVTLADGSEQQILMGLTSWGIQCGLPGIPGVFADVFKMRSWITETISILLSPQ